MYAVNKCFIESTFNNFINFVLFFCSLLFQCCLITVSKPGLAFYSYCDAVTLLKLDIYIEDGRKELPSCLTLIRRRYFHTVNRSLPSVGISVSFCKSVTFLFGSTFFIRQDMVTLSTKL